MNKMLTGVIAGSAIIVSGAAMGSGCCDSNNSQIQKQNAYSPGNHMDQYGRNVTIQPMHNNTGSNTFNQIQKQDAYGPGVHMDQYGRAVTVQPKW